MPDVRIIAVSFEDGDRLQHVSHVWTVEGATALQHVVEDLWYGRRRYHVVMPTGRIEVVPVPARGPSRLAAWLGRRERGSVEAPRGASLRDGLLTLPRLPSPTRPRRSRAMAAGGVTVSGA